MERLVDFRELEARGEPGEQFEQLMCALFEARGLRVDPSGRGPDGGIDLLIEEPIHGVITGRGTEVRRWLVWCRNHARAERSVRDDELPNILNKCGQHNVDGFVVATTTVLSVGAKNTLDGLASNSRNKCLIRQLVQYDIEQWVIENDDVFRQFLPESYRRYQELLAGPSIPEYQLQRLIEETHNRCLEPHEVRRLLAAFLNTGMSDIEAVRSIYSDTRVRGELEDIYQRLLQRDVDPLGHFTWGLVLKQQGSALGKLIVEDQIRKSPEFANRANVIVAVHFEDGPDFNASFENPSSFNEWLVYRSENCKGRIGRMTEGQDQFIRLVSDSDHGFRAMYPTGRDFGFFKSICIPRLRFVGVLQVYIELLADDGGEYWLVYQTGETNTSAADRLDPSYHVMAMTLEPGTEWLQPALRLEDDFKRAFRRTYQSIKKVSFHIQGHLDIHSLNFVTSPDDLRIEE